MEMAGLRAEKLSFSSKLEPCHGLFISIYLTTAPEWRERGMGGPPERQLVGRALMEEYHYSTPNPVTLLQNLPSRQLLPNLVFNHVKTVIT